MKKSELTVKTTVTQEEFRRFTRFNRYFRVQWQIPLILLLEAYSLYQLIGHLTGASPLEGFRLYLAWFYSVAVIIVFATNEWRIRSTRPDESTPPGKARTATMDRTGLTVLGEGKEELASFPWEGLYKVYATPKAYVLYLDEQRAIVLDRSKLKADEEIRAEAILSDGVEERYLEIGNKLSMKSNKRGGRYSKLEKKVKERESQK